MTIEQLDHLDSYQTSSAYSEKEKLALQYAEQLTLRVQTDEKLMEDLKQNGLSEQDLVELNLVVGLANLTNRFNESFKVELE